MVARRVATSVVPVRFRSAVSPVRRRVEPTPGRLPRIDEIVLRDRPEDPVHCLRPALIAATARRFVAAFPGDVLYAVKCNPEPRVLRALWDGGVRHFDCASPAEVALVRQMFPAAAIHYMHPVKARGAIAEAYTRFGVRDFAFDSATELEKILAATDGAPDLGLFVRLALPRSGAAYELAGKFGASPREAADLLKAARGAARSLGLCFHVGSQCEDPAAWTRALGLAGTVIALAGVRIDVVDVGGGFPVAYPDRTPRPLDDFMAAIREGADALGGESAPRLWAEPGRVLVAAGTSVVVQVQRVRGRQLFVSDGVYGSLSDAGAPGFRFPVRLIPADGRRPATATLEAELFGPTCDSADHMKGPFAVPACVREGDWLELGQLGAYGAALRTAFNGFERARLVDVADAPLLATAGHPAG
ncbi:MAG: type III PLP-dependent enzyme [Alphaproteobacteria bacterium]|nr:type III PLP-dependent enzyme [Alphaproteobacteria bacterium]